MTGEGGGVKGHITGVEVVGGDSTGREECGHVVRRAGRCESDVCSSVVGDGGGVGEEGGGEDGERLVGDVVEVVQVRRWKVKVQREAPLLRVIAASHKHVAV